MVYYSLYKLKIQNVVNNFEGCQIAGMRALNHSTRVRINFGTKTCLEPPFVYEGPAEPRTFLNGKVFSLPDERQVTVFDWYGSTFTRRRVNTLNVHVFVQFGLFKAGLR